MEESKAIEMIKRNPIIIKNIDNQTEEMKKLAVKANGLLLRYIKNPTEEVEKLALENNPRAIEFIENPSEEMMETAIENGWSNLNQIKNPSESIIKKAIKQRGWAIRYVKNPNEELQVLAVKKDYDSIKYIKSPCEEAQKEAVKISYDALRYIEFPCIEAEVQAIRNNESAINFISNLNKEKLLILMKENIFSEKLMYIGYKHEIKLFLYVGIFINKIIKYLFRNHNNYIYACHGACIILNYNFIKYYNFKFDDKMFLFYEEALLGLFAKKNNIKIKYDKNIIVRHFEDGSMSISNINEYNFLRDSFIYYYKRYRKL